MKYKVGQVFYLIGLETARVIPFMIVEEVTRTTISGIEKTFIAELPDVKKTKIDVLKLKGVVFDNLEELKAHMIENAKNAIATMIDQALQLSDEAFNTNLLSSYEDNAEIISEYHEEIDSVQNNTQGDKVSVDIGGGIIAKINLRDLEKVSQP
jgi:outer membrane phospholipase A